MNNKVDFEILARKQIRCMMYEDKVGDVKVVYDNFESFKNQYENVVEIYNTTKEQEEMILGIIGDNLEVEENKVKSKISDKDFLLKLLGELTNIKLELDEESDKNTIENVLNDPSYLFKRIKLEVDKICNNIFYLWYDTVKELLKTPEELREALLLSHGKNNTKQELNQEEVEKQNKILALEEELKALKGN